MKRRYLDTPSYFGLRTRGSSESAILIFGWYCPAPNKITNAFGADINDELTRK